jgi:chromosome segregation protein
VKLSFVEMSGFRGFRRPVRVDFAQCFTIIDGRNGVGKSTLFDAVEFVLTGILSKYSDAKASGETVADYIWWTGDGPAPADRYVEVGFVDGNTEFTIRRGEFGEVNAPTLKAIAWS